MANFNRGNRSGGGGFERRGFNNRDRRGPAEMHRAVCDKCRKDCEVPFRPTSGKPIFCSNCFEGNRGSDSRATNFEERRMFEATCSECRNSCSVPFQPSGDKPVYCKDCFGAKKGGEKEISEPSYIEHFELLNSKLDKILVMLAPSIDGGVEEIVVEEKSKVKKSPSKKKS